MPISAPPKDSSRVLRGRIGAARLHALHDARETTIEARRAFLGRFEREVDPDGTLPPDERERRAAHARRAHMLALSLKSAKARRERKGARHA